MSDFSILNLDPRSFAEALQELDLPPAQRDALVSAYQQERSPFAEAHAALSRQDDELAQQGLRRGTVTPMAWPAGMTGAEAHLSGEGQLAWPSMVFDIARAALTAIETPGALLSGVPLSQDQITDAATGAAELAVPGVVGARAATRAVDAAQLGQLRSLYDRIEPEFPGSPYAGAQFFHPNPAERARARDPSATTVEAEHLARRNNADLLLAQGVPAADVAALTGILSLPTTPFAQRGGIASLGPSDLRVAPVSRQEMIELRPERANDLGVRRVDDPDLPASSGVYLSPIRRRGSPPVVVHSPHSTPEQRRSVDRHEMTHADLDFGGVPGSQVGTNPSYVRDVRLQALQDLDRRIAAAANPAERAALRQQRDELGSFTPDELYQLNPGEMLARLSQDDPTTVVSLTNAELLNPYINPANFPRRLFDAANQALRSERPQQLAFGRSIADIPLEVSRSGMYRRGEADPMFQWSPLRHSPDEPRYGFTSRDYHVRGEMDLGRSRVPEFRDGGTVGAPRQTRPTPRRRNPSHRFERVWDPARGREVTRIVSGLDTPPSAR